MKVQNLLNSYVKANIIILICLILAACGKSNLGSKSGSASALDFAAGYSQSLAVRKVPKAWGSNTVWVFGCSDFGQLGLGDYTLGSSFEVRQSSSLNNDVQSVASGKEHSFVIKFGGALWAFGRNNFGQLGLAGIDSTGQGMLLKDFSAGVTKVVAGYNHTLVLKSNKTLWAFGLNDLGQLGLGNNDNKYTGEKVNFSDGVKNDILSMSGGESHSLVVKNNGTLWAFGANNLGQLGLGDNVNTNIPKQVTFSDGKNIAVEVAAGQSHSLVLRSDGTVWGFGSNIIGQLGLGNNLDSNTPKQITSLGNDVKAIAAGGLHSLAIKNDGSLWAFGLNTDGQLGLGNYADTYTPKKVINFDNDVQEVAAGNSHTLVLKNDGTLWSFGNNFNGQLGTKYTILLDNNSLTAIIKSNIPIQVIIPSN